MGLDEAKLRASLARMIGRYQAARDAASARSDREIFQYWVGRISAYSDLRERLSTYREVEHGSIGGDG